MKIGKYDITSKNIWAYIQGNTRKMMEEYGPDIFKSPQFIQEQIVWREVISNEECYKLGECTVCHCKMPDKLYSDKECEGGCYPEIMDEVKWNRFKQICNREKLNMFERGFDFNSILDKMNNLNPLYYSTITNNGIIDLGKIKQGDIVESYFELFNPDEEPLIVNHINPSCSCITVTKPNKIEKHEFGKLEFKINTSSKPLRKDEVWLTVRYNETKRINLKVQFEVING